MDARELRIGNLLQSKSTDGIRLHRVIEIKEKIYVTQSIDPDYSYIEQPLKPIPITEEWLKRFGFEHSPEAMNYNLWVGNGIVGEFIGGLFQIQASGLPQCNQVHQLQNQFNVLKNGEELEIKEQ